LNPKKLKPFSDANQIAMKKELYMINVGAWYNGIYVGRAIGSAFSKDAEYPNKPIDFTLDSKKNNKISTTDTENKALMFSAWADMFNEKFIAEHKEQPTITEGQ